MKIATRLLLLSTITGAFLAHSGAAQQPAPAPAGRITVPAGTGVIVRTVDPIDSKNNSAGYRFMVTLEADLVAEGKVVAPRGSQGFGILSQAQESGRAVGKSQLTVELTSIVINGQPLPVVTQTVQKESQSTTRKSARRTAIGAGIGAIVDGGDGAKTGAIIGASVSVITKGEQVSIPAGSVLEFRLLAPFTR